uniref:Uncharacterized protein n=1 Tax=Octopus bimaculoides TaxID=37653 RepID=A0A0L8GHA1_OCTBM
MSQIIKATRSSTIHVPITSILVEHARTIIARQPSHVLKARKKHRVSFTLNFISLYNHLFAVLTALETKLSKLMYWQ